MPLDASAADEHLASLIDAFPDEIATTIRGCRARLRAQFPDAVQVVHPGEGRLVIDFGPDPRPAHAVLSLEADVHAVRLHLLQREADRTISLTSPDDLSSDEVAAKIDAYLGEVLVLMEASEQGDVIIEEGS